MREDVEQEVISAIWRQVERDRTIEHPTSYIYRIAVRETVRAIRGRYPGRRLVAAFEPRSNTSRRALFQEAYEAQGYPDGYFNDRLVEVIDHLLATPEPRGMLELVQNEANYEYVDEELEALSAGQKALLRLSPEGRQAVKDRMRALRGALAGGPPPP